MSGIGNKEVFSRNLKHYLEVYGRDQKEVAAYVGVAPSTFNEWVRAKKYPRIDKVEMLANYFGVKKSDLIEDKGMHKAPADIPALSDDEKTLLALYRQVPDDQKVLMIQMITLAIKSKR